MTALARCKLSCARRLVGVLVLALLAMQWTALSHAILHAPALSGAAVVDDHDTLGHGAGSPVCQLVDHLLCGQAFGLATIAVARTDLRESPIVRGGPAAHDHGAGLPYEARAPPPIS